MKLFDLIRTASPVLNEGGNVSSQSPGWQGMPGDHEAEEIDLKIHNRDLMVGKLRELLHAQNEAFKAVNGRHIWNPKIINSNEMFSGSSVQFFDVKGISTQDFLNKLKKQKVGDIDTQVDQEIGDSLTAWLKSMVGKKVGNGTLVGFNASLSSIWRLDDPPVRIQVDYELGPYDPKTQKPTEWFSYSHSSNYDDMAAGIKGVFHKYINRALPYSQTSTKYVARVLKKSVKISPEPVTDSDYSFAVTSAQGGGLSAKYKPYVDPATGEPMEKDGIPVMQLLEPSQRDYIQNLAQQFEIMYGLKPKAADLKLQQGFLGTIQLANKYLDDQQREEIAHRFLEILFGNGAQMITKDDPDRDRDIKFSAVDAMLLGGDGIRPLKLSNGKQLRQEAVNMAMDYADSFKSKTAGKTVTDKEVAEDADNAAAAKPNYARQGIKHIYNRLPDGRASSVEMKDAEFIELCKEIADNGGTLNNVPINLKVDGAGIRFGKDASGRPFFMTSKVTTPLYHDDVGYFTRFGQEKGQDADQLARTKNYDNALELITGSKFIQTLPPDTIVQAEMLYNPMAQKTPDGLKFVNIPYDPKKLGKQMTLVPFMFKTYSTGESRPDADKIKQRLLAAGDSNIKIISNQLEQKGINVSKIIQPVLGLNPKDKQANKEILDKARQELSDAIINSPRLKGADVLGNNQEGIVINMPSGILAKVTSTQMKAAMAAKQQYPEYDKTPRTAVVAIGNFAGHRGHEQLIDYAIAKAKEVGGTPFVFVGHKVGPDDPIDINTKIETLKKLYPDVSVSVVQNQIDPATGEETVGNIFKKIEYELIKKPPHYNNIIITVGSDQAGMEKTAAGMQARFAKFPPLSHVKVSAYVTPRKSEEGGTGVSTTQLRNALKTMPEAEAFKVWSQAYNVKKLGVDWIKHLMDVARKNMGIKQVPAPTINKPAQPNTPPTPVNNNQVAERLFLALIRPNKIVTEGGWTTGDNPGIKAKVVKQGIVAVQNFLKDFNPWLEKQGLGPMKVGHPTGSAAYHELDDPENTIYGDMDLQVIIPDLPEYDDMTSGQLQGRWGALINKFIQDSNLSYIDKEESRGSQPMFILGDGSKVQVDIMPHPEKTSEWGRFRATGEHGLKGLLNGNIFATMSELIPVNLQHKGIQYKTVNGKKVNYGKTLKGYDLHTVGSDIKRWILDIFLHEAQELGIENPKIDPLLKANPGVDTMNVNVERLVNGVKGFARSCELNQMFGQGDLERFSSAEDFLNQFVHHYVEKSQHAISAPKRDKASTAASQARAVKDREALSKGLEYVKKLFSGEVAGQRYRDYSKPKENADTGPGPLGNKTGLGTGNYVSMPHATQPMESMKDFPFAGKSVGQKAGIAGQARGEPKRSQKAPLTGLLVGESASLNTTISNIVDNGKYIAQVYETLKSMAKRWVDNRGDLKGFHMMAGGVGHRWFNDFYFNKLQSELFDLTKQASKYSVPLITFLKNASENRDRHINFKEISEHLPVILTQLGNRLGNKDLSNFGRHWALRQTEYENYLVKIEHEANQGDYDEPAKVNSPKDTTHGQQMSKAEEIVNDILRKLPSKISGEIRNAISRSPNKLQALQKELHKRKIEVENDDTGGISTAERPSYAGNSYSMQSQYFGE
jgi:hypothetical protein